MGRRDELIKDCCWKFGSDKGNDIASYILRREREMAEKITPSLELLSKMIIDPVVVGRFGIPIDKALVHHKDLLDFLNTLKEGA